jgi:hypothetical protein
LSQRAPVRLSPTTELKLIRYEVFDALFAAWVRGDNFLGLTAPKPFRGVAIRPERSAIELNAHFVVPSDDGVSPNVPLHRTGVRDARPGR